MRMRETIAVIGEGITEYYYIQSIKDCVKIKPKAFIPKNSGVKELENCIKSCISSGYSKVFCLIDMDNKSHDGVPEHEANRKKYLELKKKYHAKEHKHAGGKTLVKMLESYPSSEMFFYYYFKYSTASFGNNELKRLLNERTGYETTEKFLRATSLHNLFCCKEGDLKRAIEHACKSVDNRENGNPHAGFSEIGELFDYLVLK